ISNPDSIAEKVLEHHIAQQTQIPFVGFWGVGDKPLPDRRDNEYIAELNSIRESVQSQYEPGASIALILADLHGQFNGFIPNVEDNRSSSYLYQISKILAEQDIRPIWLRGLYEAHSLQLPNINDRIDYFSEAGEVYAKYSKQYVRSAERHHQHEETIISLDS
ncbi:hypothetical protein HY024_04815, partial [Candidatus Curtissbacteria bacterium]|nr:hypothetical protein [Candidatus Curtissbacteria bacterium]